MHGTSAAFPHVSEPLLGFLPSSVPVYGGGGELLKATHTVKRIFFNSDSTTLKKCKIKESVKSKE